MTSSLRLPSSPSSTSASPLVQAVQNNHVPPDFAPSGIAALPAVPTRESLLETMAETDAAIQELNVLPPFRPTGDEETPADWQEKLLQLYFRNATFSREDDGLRNLNGGIDWFTSVKQQATENGQIAVVPPIPPQNSFHNKVLTYCRHQRRSTFPRTRRSIQCFPHETLKPQPWHSSTPSIQLSSSPPK